MCKEEKDVFAGKLGIVEGCGTETFQIWNCETYGVGSRRRPDRARVAVDRAGVNVFGEWWETA